MPISPPPILPTSCNGAARVKENHELLSRLDAATGDGDHGVTMKRVAEAIIDSVAEGQSLGAGPLLEQVGWNVMSVDGGSTSPLLGSFFMGMSEAAASASRSTVPPWPPLLRPA